MEGWFIRVIIAGAIYYALQTFLKEKSKAEPNVYGLHIASILSCAYLLSAHQKSHEPDGDFYISIVIMFITFYGIGYAAGFLWRKMMVK